MLFNIIIFILHFVRSFSPWFEMSATNDCFAFVGVLLSAVKQSVVVRSIWWPRSAPGFTFVNSFLEINPGGFGKFDFLFLREGWVTGREYGSIFS